MLQGWFLNQFCVLSSYYASHMGEVQYFFYIQTYFFTKTLLKKVFFGSHVHNSFEVVFPLSLLLLSLLLILNIYK